MIASFCFLASSSIKAGCNFTSTPCVRWCPQARSFHHHFSSMWFATTLPNWGKVTFMSLISVFFFLFLGLIDGRPSLSPFTVAMGLLIRQGFCQWQDLSRSAVPVLFVSPQVEQPVGTATEHIATHRFDTVLWGASANLGGLASRIHVVARSSRLRTVGAGCRSSSNYDSHRQALFSMWFAESQDARFSAC